MTDLAELAALVRAPDETSREQARVRQSRLTKPTGALGRLEELSIWVSGVQGSCPPHPFADPRVVVFAGDHGVARTAQTSAYPPEVTAQMVANFARGGAAVNVLAGLAGARVRVVDVGVDADPAYLDDLAPDVARRRVRRSSGSIDREDALTLDEATAAFELGRTIADEEIDSGADLLMPGDMGIGNTTPAAPIIGLLTGHDASVVTGLGTGIDDATWMRKASAVREAMRRGRDRRGEPLRLLATVGNGKGRGIGGCWLVTGKGFAACRRRWHWTLVLGVAAALSLAFFLLLHQVRKATRSIKCIS